MDIVDTLPLVKAVIVWGVSKIPEEYSKDARVYTFANFLELGKDLKEIDL